MFFQSLDYDLCENTLLLKEAVGRGYPFITRKALARWFIFCAIGVCTAFVGIFIDITIEELAAIKYSNIKSCIFLFLGPSLTLNPYS